MECRKAGRKTAEPSKGSTRSLSEGRAMQHPIEKLLVPREKGRGDHGTAGRGFMKVGYVRLILEGKSFPCSRERQTPP